MTNLTEFTNLTNMTNLTITQIIGMYQHIAQLLQPLGEITISLFPNLPDLPSLPDLPDLPYPISPTASQSTAEGFSTGTALRDFTDFPNPQSAESVDSGKAAAYPKGGFTAPYALPQFYGYSVLNSGNPSANVEFFTAINPDFFDSTASMGSSGSATINPVQKTLNNITKQYSTAVTKSTSAINPIFTENSFSRVDFFSDNGLNSDVFQNSSITENHLQKAVFSPHKGEELRQAVKTASSSSVYNGGTEIRVDMSGMRNTVNSRTDLDELIDRLCTELSQAALSAAEGVHF